MIRAAAFLVTLLLVTAVAGPGCPGESQPVADAPGGDATPLQDSIVLDSLARREPGALVSVKADTVAGRTGPGEHPFEVGLRTPDAVSGRVRRFGNRPLPIQLRIRSPDLTRYPCTSCHQGSRLVMADKRIPDAHTDLRVVHPTETGSTCATCHAPENPELLVLGNRDRTTLDHAYQLCATCHFPQVESWAGGAHGKRFDGWQGRRVVMGCADCHDPHAPALETRMPFRPPRLHRSGTRTP